MSWSQSLCVVHGKWVGGGSNLRTTPFGPYGGLVPAEAGMGFGGGVSKPKGVTTRVAFPLDNTMALGTF